MKTYVICRVCKAVYWNKAWHHGNTVKVRDLRDGYFAWASRCPACKMSETDEYRGLITIHNIPHRSSKELLRLIKDYSQRAYEKNCQHRVLKVNKVSPTSWDVTTSETQLANKLARKISEAFDHVVVKTPFSTEPKQRLRVLVDFLPLFYHRFNY